MLSGHTFKSALADIKCIYRATNPSKLPFKVFFNMSKRRYLLQIYLGVLTYKDINSHF